MSYDLLHAEGLSLAFAALPETVLSTDADTGQYARAAENLCRFCPPSVGNSQHLEDADDIAHGRIL